jgi:translation elongation factor P/translation initiation factor 5A
MENGEIKTGSLIVVDGKTLVVTDIRTEEKIGGRAVHISACDQETARTAQMRNIQGNDTAQQIMDMIQKMSGGKFPGMGGD